MEITGARPDDVQERRQSTAAKIVVGRDEIERFGDATLGDVLRRLPGVTMQGAPGRGGAIRMRGLGSGYTQILLDGERVPPGFSLDSLTPEQVERIEILRAPTAETGARAIAGTINIVTREGFAQARQRPAASAAASRTAGCRPARLVDAQRQRRRADAQPLAVGLHRERDERQHRPITARRDLDRRQRRSAQRERPRAVARRAPRPATPTARLQWRGDGGDIADADRRCCLAIRQRRHRRARSASTQRRRPPTPPRLRRRAAATATAASSLGAPERRSGRAGSARAAALECAAASARRAVASERACATSRTGGGATRTLDDRSDDARPHACGSAPSCIALARRRDHSLVAGVEAEGERAATSAHDAAERRAAARPSSATTLAGLARPRLAAYAQDEWSADAATGRRTPGCAGKASRRAAAAAQARADPSNRSSVWTPLLHAVWKPDPKSRDQVRISLTRSYRSPTLRHADRPADASNALPTRCRGRNTATQPDRAGNPDLKPELATGIDLAVERYLAGGGMLSANVFHRRISDLHAQRHLARDGVAWTRRSRATCAAPRNIGDADHAGPRARSQVPARASSSPARRGVDAARQR